MNVRRVSRCTLAYHPDCPQICHCLAVCNDPPASRQFLQANSSDPRCLVIELWRDGVALALGVVLYVKNMLFTVPMWVVVQGYCAALKAGVVVWDWPEARRLINNFACVCHDGSRCFV